jgi:hypothetical protein
MPTHCRDAFPRRRVTHGTTNAEIPWLPAGQVGSNLGCKEVSSSNEECEVRPGRTGTR